MSNDSKYCISLFILCVSIGIYWIIMKNPKKIRRDFKDKVDEKTLKVMERLSIAVIILL